MALEKIEGENAWKTREYEREIKKNIKLLNSFLKMYLNIILITMQNSSLRAHLFLYFLKKLKNLKI
jgi:hypothetical protein